MSFTRKACFFTGHRIISGDKNKLIGYLREEILDKINSGVTVFITGGAIGFDTIAAEQVIEMREDYDFIRLCLYLPCTNQDAEWCEADKSRFCRIAEMADEIYHVTGEEYKRGCMKKRNKAMVEAADCGISYLKGRSGGTAQTVRLAREKGIDVINIAEKWNI